MRKSEIVDQAMMIEKTGFKTSVATLGDLESPCRILHAERMERNIARLRGRLAGFDVSLRPHLKTAKSIGHCSEATVAGGHLYVAGSRRSGRRRELAR